MTHDDHPSDRRADPESSGGVANPVSTVLIGARLVWSPAADLHVPEEWATDAPRRATVRVRTDVESREKWQIALAQLQTVRRAGFTVTGVVADAD